MPTPSERLKRFLANRGTGFSTDDLAEVLATIERMDAVLAKFDEYNDAEYVPNSLFDLARAARKEAT